MEEEVEEEIRAPEATKGVTLGPMEDLRDNLVLSRVKEDLLLHSSSNLIIILAT